MPSRCRIASVCLAWSLALGAASAQPALTLDEALAIGRRSNPALAAADQAVRAAVARTGQVRADLLPQVAMQVAEEHTTTSLTAKPRGGGSIAAVSARTHLQSALVPAVRATQLITDFGLTPARVRSARSLADAADEDLRAARISVDLDVKTAYYLLLATQRRCALARETVEARAALLASSQELVERGLRSEFDASRATVLVADAKLLERQAQVDREVAARNLDLALGEPDRPAYTVEDVLEGPQLKIELAAVEREALERRPELAAQRKLVNAAKAALAAAEAEYFGTVGASVTRRRLDTEADLIDATERETSVAVALDVPIFQGGRIKNDVREARARLAQVRALHEARRQAVLQEARNAHSTLVAARDRVELARQLVASADQNLAVVTQRYEGGFAAVIDISDAQSQRTSAQLVLIGALADERIAQARLERALGRG